MEHSNGTQWNITMWYMHIHYAYTSFAYDKILDCLKEKCNISLVHV